MSDEQTRSQLIPLVSGTIGDDPNDDLKGYGLCACWSLISLDELLKNITQPKSQAIGGVYQTFLARDFAQNLDIRDIPKALNWLETLPTGYNLNYPFDHLAILLSKEPGII